jgi:hypothetical protein
VAAGCERAGGEIGGCRPPPAGPPTTPPSPRLVRPPATERCGARTSESPGSHAPSPGGCRGPPWSGARGIGAPSTVNASCWLPVRTFFDMNRVLSNTSVSGQLVSARASRTMGASTSSHSATVAPPHARSSRRRSERARARRAACWYEFQCRQRRTLRRPPALGSRTCARSPARGAPVPRCRRCRRCRRSHRGCAAGAGRARTGGTHQVRRSGTAVEVVMPPRPTTRCAPTRTM